MGKCGSVVDEKDFEDIDQQNGADAPNGKAPNLDSYKQAAASNANATAANKKSATDADDGKDLEQIENVVPNAQIGALLENVPLLAKLTHQERAILGGALTEKTFKDEKIVVEGDAGNEFFIIKEGRALVTRYAPETKTQTELCELKTGDYFGETALLNNSARGATIAAVGQVICFVMTRKKFTALFGKNKLNVAFAKRAAISAETSSASGAQELKHLAPANANRTKSAKQRKMILNAVKQNVLFQNLDPEQQEQVVDQMWLKDVMKGGSVIKQGEMGDNFYIVESGSFDIFIKKPNEQPVCVATRASGTSFGELALMYNARRAATVTATEDSSVWAVDRWTFRRILTGTSEKKLKEYEHFLEGVRSFAVLAKYERAKIAEALEEVAFPDNHDIIKQGDDGDTFFIIKKGEVVVTMSKKAGEPGDEIARYHAGDYFGERALVKNEARAATITTVGAVQCLYLDRQAFTMLLGPLEDIFTKRVQSYADHSSIKGRSSNASPPTPSSAIASASNRTGSDFKSSTPPMSPNTTNGTRVGGGAGSSNVKSTKLSVPSASPPALTSPTAQTNGGVGASAAGGAGGSSSLVGSGSTSAAGSGGGSMVGAEVEENHLRTDIKLSDLRVIGTLGKGSFGHVQLVEDKQGITYALKVVSKAQIVQLGQQEHIMSEKRVMAQLNHNFLVKLHATFKDKNCLYFLLEPSLGGELFSVLRQKTFFDEHTARFFAAGVVLAFEYMHSKDIVYRDLKPENLLLDQRGYIKITDFGFAKKVKDRTWTLCGTPDYLAPEVVSGQGHGKGVDWWTLGILVYEMLASYPPFYDEDPMKTYAKIMHGQVAFPMHFSKPAVDLIRRLLHSKPTKRLGVVKGGAKLVKEHPWFKGFNWEAFEKQSMEAPIVLPVKDKYDLSNFEEYPEEETHFDEYVPDPKNPDWEGDF